MSSSSIAVILSLLLGIASAVLVVNVDENLLERQIAELSVQQLLTAAGKSILPDCTYNPEKITYLLYVGSNQQPIKIKVNDAEMKTYPGTKPRMTKILIHDWLDSPDSTDDMRIKYQKSGNLNVIVVDWKAFSFCDYKTTRLNILPEVGNSTGYLIKEFGVAFGWNPSTIQIIGIGLGAHMGGYTGRYLKPSSLRRLTALDPLGSMYDYRTYKDGLDSNSAAFVDIIHTNDYTGRNIGQVDFYPNNGTIQPGCRPHDNLCSHRRSVEFYSESIDYPKNLCAGKTKSYFTYLICSSNIPADKLGYMGEAASTSYQGTYYLITGDKPPYGLGCNIGVNCEKVIGQKEQSVGY